jgi:hypothetical protein
LAWNGAGTYVLPPAYTPEVDGTVVEASRYNGTTSDIAAGITNALAKDGQNVPTNNLNMAGFRLTGLGVPTTTGDALSFNQAQGNAVSFTTRATGNITFTSFGTASAYVLVNEGSIQFIDPTQSANNHEAELLWNGGGFTGRFVKDDYSAAINWLSVAGGYALGTTSITWNATLHQWAVGGTAVLDVVATGIVPVTNNAFACGSGGARWSNMLSVLGNFSGLLTASAGVTFDGTNTLANYAQANYTAQVKFGGAAVGMTGTFIGRYTRIGNRVLLQVTVGLTAVGSSTGVATIDLPIAANATANVSPIHVILGTSMTALAAGNTYAVQIVPGASTLSVVSASLTGASSGVTASTQTAFTATTSFSFELSYEV